MASSHSINSKHLFDLESALLDLSVETPEVSVSERKLTGSGCFVELSGVFKKRNITVSNGPNFKLGKTSELDCGSLIYRDGTNLSCLEMFVFGDSIFPNTYFYEPFEIIKS